MMHRLPRTKRKLESKRIRKGGCLSSPGITAERSLDDTSTRGAPSNPAALGVVHTSRLSVTKSLPPLYGHGRRVERAHIPDHLSCSPSDRGRLIALRFTKKRPGTCRLSSAANKTTRSVVAKKTISRKVLLKSSCHKAYNATISPRVPAANMTSAKSCSSDTKARATIGVSPAAEACSLIHLQSPPSSARPRNRTGITVAAVI